ncbi:MAG: ABC transporter substrate-binding protein [Pseudodesulfovibrio sp.]
MVPSRSCSAILLIALLLAMTACSDSAPIIIGYSGQLTGKISDLGVQARNGVQLAVETINSEGGIDGRMLRIIAKDDGNNPATALQVDKELIAAGAVAVIGHATSSQTLAVLPYFNENNIALISPTATTSLLTGRKDAFSRVTNDNSIQGRELGEYARMALNIKTIITVAETDNGEYSLPLARTFSDIFTENGGQVLSQLTYSSRHSLDWETVIQRVLVQKPQAILLICPAYDAVSLIQQIRSNRLNIQILIGSWAYTSQLLYWGGQDVEGAFVAMDYADDNPNPSFVKFREAYKNRFGNVPSYAAAFGYDAVIALTAGLEKTRGRAEGLVQAMAPSGPLNGVSGTFKLDEFGDVRRNIYIITVLDGRFSTISVR